MERDPEGKEKQQAMPSTPHQGEYFAITRLKFHGKAFFSFPCLPRPGAYI